MNAQQQQQEQLLQQQQLAPKHTPTKIKKTETVVSQSRRTSYYGSQSNCASLYRIQCVFGHAHCPLQQQQQQQQKQQLVAS